MHPCLDVVAVKYFHDIPKSICIRNHAKQVLQKYTIFLTEFYHNYILEEIERRDRIDSERNLREYWDEEQLFSYFNSFDFFYQ